MLKYLVKIAGVSDGAGARRRREQRERRAAVAAGEAGGDDGYLLLATEHSELHSQAAAEVLDLAHPSGTDTPAILTRYLGNDD